MRRTKPFCADRRGNVAMMFGLAILPLFVCIGATIDFGRMTAAHSMLQTSTDAATLDAVIFAAGQVASGGNPSHGKVRAKFSEMLAARATGTRSYDIVSSNATYSKSASSITIVSSASASVTPMFGKFLGKTAYTVSTTSTVTQELGMGTTYGNISLVLDVSPSMAIAATSADIQALQSVTPNRCAFACHDVESGTWTIGGVAPSGTTNYEIARANNVTLRIDVVKSAAQSMTDYISSNQTLPGQYSMGLYTMGRSLTARVPPTTNLSSVKNAISTVDFDKMTNVLTPALNIPSSLTTGMWLTNYADSDFKTTFASMNASVPAPGDGGSAASRSQFVFFVTDGVSNVPVPVNGSVSASYTYPSVPDFRVTGNNAGKTTQPIDPSWCDQFKSRGITVGVLYVTYVPDPADPTGNYQWLVQTNAPPDKLVSNLTACASPGLFRQASDASQISTMLQDMFKTIAGSARVKS